MNDDDKPFACTYNGCSMKFVTEDHLSVHKNLHEKRQQLSLNLSHAGEQLVDQTPTPSRFLGNFLKNLEDTGLRTCEIDDVVAHKSSNPFEETFRKASNSPNALRLKVNLPNHVFNEESLNTPSIDDSMLVSTPLPLKFPIVGKPLEEATPLIDRESNEETNAYNINNVESDNIEIIQKSTGETIPESNLPVNTISLPVPVICVSTSSAETVIKSTDSAAINSAISNEKRSNLVTKPAIPSVQSTMGPSLPSVSKPIFLLPKSQVIPGIVTQTPIYQVVVCKVNNGNSLQVIPPVPQINDKLSTVSVLKPKEQSVAAEKVQQLAVKPIIPSPVINEMNNTPLPTTTINQTVSQPSSSQVLQDGTESYTRSKPGRRSKSAPREDPKERKARALERNRAAASRCRKKKKVWIESLEENAAELEASKEKLQAEVDKLRNEVALLKSALLEHKDCPVTLKQLRVGGREIGKRVTS